MPRLSKELILHGIRTYGGTEEAELHIFGSQCKAEVRKSNFTSWGMMAEWKSGSGTSAIWQSWQSGSELHIFGNSGRVLVGKPNFRSFWQSMQSRSAEAELHTCGSLGRTSAEAELEIFRSPGRTEVRRVELHIFGSQGSTEMRK